MKRAVLFTLMIFSFSFFSAAETSKEGGIDAAAFRGQRVDQSQMDKPCQIQKITSQKQDNQLQINVFFSNQVDPRSFTGENIFINGQKQTAAIKIVFNREGTQARFSVTCDFPVTLTLKGIQSISGQKVPDYSREL